MWRRTPACASSAADARTPTHPARCLQSTHRLRVTSMPPRLAYYGSEVHITPGKYKMGKNLDEGTFFASVKLAVGHRKRNYIRYVAGVHATWPAVHNTSRACRCCVGTAHPRGVGPTKTARCFSRHPVTRCWRLWSLGASMCTCRRCAVLGCVQDKCHLCTHAVVTNT
jgi:hypothetical protein